jgi:hypothetical protein
VTFTAHARKLAGVAGTLLGWTPDIFWSATPEDLTTVLEALRGEVAEPPDLKSLMESFPDG